ncbi:DoxX family protein [Rhodococcus sp. PvR099]|uniref:DoxX family protein n=1 Tax=Rhodococcus sp. PvR099 TaxID=2806602 RepID=UPI001AEA30CB|nr:DoxX family protein [Rhodococcus sp. PvR099]MBP1159060.1 putative membrane protein YphA (DoxX/SURF4 family) [Rhodococcus sp. PvR099]
MLVRRIARPLLATVFITGGIDALRHPAGKADIAEPVIQQAHGALPDRVAALVPSDPTNLVRLNGAIQVGAGALLAIGKAPRIASLTLASSLLPTTLAGHAFWNESDPLQRAAHRTQFFKNMSLLGGLLIAGVDTEGKPSLGWRGRRAARQASDAVLAALPALPTAKESEAHGAVGERLQSASERVRELAAEAAERGAVLAETAQEHAPELLALARERGAALAETAQERAPELLALAREHGTEWTETAAERGARLGHTVGVGTERAVRRARRAVADLNS